MAKELSPYEAALAWRERYKDLISVVRYTLREYANQQPKDRVDAPLNATQLASILELQAHLLGPTSIMVNREHELLERSLLAIRDLPVYSFSPIPAQFSDIFGRQIEEQLDDLAKQYPYNFPIVAEQAENALHNLSRPAQEIAEAIKKSCHTAIDLLTKEILSDPQDSRGNFYKVYQIITQIADKENTANGIYDRPMGIALKAARMEVVSLTTELRLSLDKRPELARFHEVGSDLILQWLIDAPAKHPELVSSPEGAIHLANSNDYGSPERSYHVYAAAEIANAVFSNKTGLSTEAMKDAALALLTSRVDRFIEAWESMDAFRKSGKADDSIEGRALGPKIMGLLGSSTWNFGSLSRLVERGVEPIEHLKTFINPTVPFEFSVKPAARSPNTGDQQPRPGG